MNRLAGRIAVDVFLELERSPLNAARRTQARHEDAIAGRFELGRDAGKVVERRRPDADAIEAEQAMHENDRSTQRGDGHAVILRPVSRQAQPSADITVTMTFALGCAWRL